MKVFGLTDRAESVVYQEHKEVLKLELKREILSNNTDEPGTGNKNIAKVTGKVTGKSGCRVRLVNCKAENVRGAASENDGKDTVIILERDGEFSCEVE